VQKEVWQEVVNSAPNGKITAKHIKGIIEQYTEQRKLPSPKSKPKRVIPECQQCQAYREEIAGLHARIAELEEEVRKRTTNTHPTLQQMEAKIAEFRSQAKTAQFFGMKETTFKDWLKKQREAK
jgi:hypothetical protein